MAKPFSVGGLMVRNDRPSFSEWFPLHLERLMPLVDHLYVRIDKTGNDVVPYLEPYGEKVSWDWQFDHPNENHLEDKERQAILDWGLETGAEWMHCFDSDEVLEEGAAQALRTFIEGDPKYRILMYPISYTSHHRKGYLLDRSETDVRVARSFRLNEPTIANYRYVGDSDGLHCGTLPGQGRRSTAILKEIFTIHYHATTPEEWLFKRNFYDNTEEVRKHGGIEVLYPLCGDFPYQCGRFGHEKNARPYDEVVTDGPERWTRLDRRLAL